MTPTDGSVGLQLAANFRDRDGHIESRDTGCSRTRSPSTETILGSWSWHKALTLMAGNPLTELGSSGKAAHGEAQLTNRLLHGLQLFHYEDAQSKRSFL